MKVLRTASVGYAAALGDTDSFLPQTIRLLIRSTNSGHMV